MTGPGLALGLMIAVRAAFAADEIHWTITGQTSVAFSWRGSLAERTIRYGKTPMTMVDSVVGVTPSPTPNSSPGPFWEARITGLEENRVYYYRIGNEPRFIFRTPPPRGSSNFWFAEQADVGSSLNWANVSIMQEMILQNFLTGNDMPRFVLVAGDLTYGDQNDLADVDQHFNDVMAWSRIAAYMPAWGNHEWATGGSADNLNNYEGRFVFPNSQTTPGASVAVGNGPADDWYWFDYGNVRFISFPEPFDGTWNDWAADVQPIMAAAQSDPAISFIVTFGHRPCWSSGADHDGEATLAGHMSALAAQYTKYVLGFHAHSHHYERTVPALTGGVLHVIGSGGGSSLGGLRNPKPGWSAFRMDHLVHLRMHVQADRIDGYAICGPDGSGSTVSCVEGSVIDAWTVLAPVVAVPRPPGPDAGLRVTAEPNPALGSVALSVVADAPGEQVLEVHDVSGRRVRRLADGWQAGGVRRVLWNGTDDAGGPAPAGVYLVTLRLGAREARTRVTLLR